MKVMLVTNVEKSSHTRVTWNDILSMCVQTVLDEHGNVRTVEKHSSIRVTYDAIYAAIQVFNTKEYTYDCNIIHQCGVLIFPDFSVFSSFQSSKQPISFLKFFSGVEILSRISYII